LIIFGFDTVNIHLPIKKFSPMKNVYAIAGKSALAMAIVSTLTLSGCEKESVLPEETVSSASSAVALPDHPVVPNELLVKFKAGAAESAKANALSRVGGRAKEKIMTKAMERAGDKEGIMVIYTPLAVFEAVSKLKGLGEVVYAEPNYIYTHDATSNDPYYTQKYLWGMYGDKTSPTNQYGSQAGEAWAANHTGSTSVHIGIIDEGVMHTHTDLNANIWINPYDKADGVDNDGNGYVDDIRGWDFDGNNNSTYDGTHDNHGTHVAGTIGAERNGSGVVGVNWSVKMIVVKFLGSNGGTLSNAIKAIDYITDLKTRHGLNIPATNNSWGGGGFSQGLYDAIERANKANILLVAAVGNGGSDGVGDDNDVTPHYPSSYANANVIAVASITSSGAKSGFSNYGAKSVDLAAPGSGIYSTIPGKDGKSAYGSYNGTSMATPHVTGAVALYKSTHSSATAADIKTAILNSKVSTSSMTGKCVSGGRLNAGSF
jgi:subtilisin family serine protease